MIIDFSKINFEDSGSVEQPQIALCNPNKEILGYLAHAEKMKALLCFNDLSEFSFTLPCFGDETLYDKVVGKRLILVEPYGYFVLAKPKETGDGIKKYKECSAYSLERELEDKKIASIEGTYKLYDATNPDNADTILGMVHKIAPSWNVGTVDADLFDASRHISLSEKNLYEWLMNEIQQTYMCVFSFDTYTRTINVKAVKNLGKHTSVFLSKDNAITKLTTEECSDDIITCLEVYGADSDVNIRKVNPRGDNYIYNYDYFMNEKWFPGEMKIPVISGDMSGEISDINGNSIVLDTSKLYFAKSLKQGADSFEYVYIEHDDTEWIIAQEVSNSAKGFINKWYDYCAAFKKSQQKYSNYVDLQNIYSAKLDTLQIELGTLELERTEKEKLLELRISEGYINTEDNKYDEYYKAIYNSTDGYNVRIKKKNAEIDEVDDKIRKVEKRLTSYNNALSFDKFFSENELLWLDNITYVDTLKEDSFIYSEESFAGSVDMSGDISQETTVSFVVQYSDSREIDTKDDEILGSYNTTYLKLTNTSIQLSSYDKNFGLNISDGVISYGDGKFDFCGKFVDGTVQSEQDGEVISVTDGTVSFSGEYSDISEETKKKTFTISSGTVYVTRSSTSSDKVFVCQKLYDYASEKIFPTINAPSYEFDVDAENFIFLQQFEEFRRTMNFGDCICVEKHDGSLIYPLLLKAELDFENLSSLSLTFSNKLKTGEAEYDLEQLFRDSFTGAANNSYERSKYVSFTKSGAKSSLLGFINSALDASKNKIINSDNQDFVMDSNGLKGRRMQDSGSYSDEQVWFSNNQIVFTDDGWQSAKTAIGKIYLGDGSENYVYGISAEALYGKLIAGSQLVIESETNNIDGSVSFRVDSSGVSINNSRFTISKGSTDIVLDPECGIGMGQNLYQIQDGKVVLNYDSDSGTWGNASNPFFYIDSDGNGHFKGTIEATDGKFNGDVRAKKLYLGENGTDVLKEINGVTKIDGTVIRPEGIEVTKGASGKNIFAVSQDGVVYLGDYDSGTGIMVGSDGVCRMGKDIVFSWSSDNSPVCVLYARTALSKPTNSYSSYPNSSTTAWHKTMSSQDKYASYSYDGGTTWTTAVKVVGTDGTDGSDADVPNYIKSTYIDFNQVSAPQIKGNFIMGGEVSGGKFFGGEYWNSEKGAYLKVGSTNGSNFADFSLFRNNSTTPCYQIYDEGSSITFRIFGKQFMYSSGETTYPTGTWDFSKGTFKGLKITFG